jgi:hypothetical protein
MIWPLAEIGCQRRNSSPPILAWKVSLHASLLDDSPKLFQDYIQQFTIVNKINDFVLSQLDILHSKI